MFAGANSAVTENAPKAVAPWSAGQSVLVGRTDKLNPPFAEMVNGAAGHALYFDDVDRPANAHPSAVILPALLALASERSDSGRELLDAHILGVEVMQRLGEARNMDHYLRGWLSTVKLGTLGAAAACARIARFDYANTASAISLGGSIASRASQTKAAILPSSYTLVSPRKTASWLALASRLASTPVTAPSAWPGRWARIALRNFRPR